MGPVTATTDKEKADEARNRGRGMSETQVIHTHDQRLRVFVSSTLAELAAERRAVREAVSRLRLVPTMFELGARSHPPREVYRAYLAQSHIFVAVYWQSYGWVAPGERVSGLEDEYRLSAGLPRLIYVKSPAEDRDPRLAQMLDRITDEGGVSYQNFSEPAELQQLVENDLAVLLTERFTVAQPPGGTAAGDEPPLGDALPVPPTPLVGREEAVAAVEALVRRDGVRLVTLTGPGGSGKSRLALEVAGRLRPGFADGVRFIDLTSVPSADLVPGTIAAGLGLNTSGTRIGTDLVSYLRSRRVLLVLDNFEQVTGAAPLLAQLLAAAPGLVLLVTSRSVLRLSGEHEFPVLPLPAPPAGAAPDADLHGRYPSVRLFMERAQAVAPEFRLTAQNAGTVAEICRRLDGLPLAIELAAARIRLLPPRALLARLGGRMSVLTGGPRDLPERQRTLKNTLDWSFALLSPSERALFERLGVFAGTFSLPAVEAVYAEAGAPGRADSAGLAIDALNSLAGSSLVQSQTRCEEPRFRLLETIREYALERLRSSGAWQEAHDRHAAYFAGLATPAESELGGEGQLAWLSRLETEAGNLSAALSWLMDQDRLDEAIAFIWRTWRFWFLRGHLDDVARHAEKFLARSGEMALHERAMALSGSGFTLISYGDQDRGQSAFERSLPLFREAGDPLGGALAAAALGHVLGAQNDPKRGGELLEHAMSLLREADTGELTAEERVYHLLDVALADNFLGQIELGNAEHDRAAQLFAAGLDAARSTADWFTVLVSLYDLALTSQARGDLDGAAELLREGLPLAAEAGDEPSAAYYLEALATIARLRDDPDRAARLLAAADAQLQTSGSGWLHAYVPRAPHDHTILAELRSRLGDAAYEQAAADGRSLAGTRAMEYGLDDAQPGQEGRKTAA
jgi:predicted ATPase